MEPVTLPIASLLDLAASFAGAIGAALAPVTDAGSATPLPTGDPLGAILQEGSGVTVDVDFSAGNVLGSAVGSFLTTLIVGGIMVAIAEDYTERKMATIVDEAIGSFVYGLVCLLFLVLVVFVLVLTGIGIIVAIPLVLLSYLVWAVGSAIAFLAIGDRLVGHEDGWLKPLLVAAGLNGLLTLTGIGGIVSFGVGAAGFGAVLKDYLE